MLRVLEQLFGWRFLDKLSAQQNADAVAEIAHHGKIMRDEEERKAVLILQVAEQVHDLRLNGHVQRRDRLVCHKKLRLHAKRPRDGDSLPLAAGELGGVFVEINLV